LGLTEQLKEMGIRTSRMKTGTPPRIDLSSVDLTQSVLQEGDVNPEKFSFLPYLSTAQSFDQMPCYIFHTNEKVHDILRSGFKDSPLFNGLIHGKGPRYCPSIEDKLRTFPDKDSHQLFLEPEGRHTKEYYLQGFSSSLPLQVQLDALHAINGLQNAKIYKPAYAVEYDYFDPGQLSQSLESQVVDCLFLAGQVNGTTGYEEAAGQGIIAGINAALKSLGKEPFVLGRDEAYIGVLIDDLITKGVDEPYRMFTSRAEYRILLRQDNADFRLTSKSHDIGLASEYRYDFTSRKYDKISLLSDFALSVNIKPDAVNAYLESIDSAPVSESKKISDILSRPGTKFSDLIKIVPRGTIQSHSVDSSSLKLDHISSFDFNSIDFLKTDVVLTDDSPEFNTLNSLYLDELYTSVEIQLKYQGYIGREERNAGKISRLENLIIPDDFDFSRLSGLSIECRQKLAKYKPHTISQASRISGVSPSDISVLLVYFGR
jgi:tRNA uridine 5-carboxymethylaminomethyl modification enzyme